LTQDIFRNEHQLLNEFENLIHAEDSEPARVIECSDKVIKKFRTLIKTTEKMIKMGDRYQKSLLETSEKIKQQNEEIEKKNRALYLRSITDKMTGIYNREHVLELLKQEFMQSKRYGNNFSCAMMDIDHFKNFNDTYGHLIGDFVLKETTHVISQSIRESDMFGRYGGEEFLLVLPNTKIADAFPFVDKIRTKIADHAFVIGDLELSVRISIGITDNLAKKPKNIDALLKNADDALYQAKKNGRNQTVQFISSS